MNETAVVCADTASFIKMNGRNSSVCERALGELFESVFESNLRLEL